MGEPVFWPKFSLTAPKLLRTRISRTTARRKLNKLSKLLQALIYYRCFQISIPLRQLEVPFFVFGAYIMTKLHDFPYLVKSWLSPQNDRKNGFIVVARRYVYHSDSGKCPNSACFFFVVVLFGRCMMKLHKFSYHETHISYKIG